MSVTIKAFKGAWDRLRTIAELAAKIGQATPEAIPPIFNDFRKQLAEVQRLFVEAYPEMPASDARAIRGIIKTCREFDGAAFARLAASLPRRMEVALSPEARLFAQSVRVPEPGAQGDADDDARSEESDSEIAREVVEEERVLVVNSGPSRRLLALLLIAVLGGATIGAYFAFFDNGKGVPVPPPPPIGSGPERPKPLPDDPDAGPINQPIPSGPIGADGIPVAPEARELALDQSMPLLRARDADLLLALDLRYSLHHEGQALLEARLKQLLDATAAWREAGTSGALADEFRTLAGLTLYDASAGGAALLPSEVMALGGGEALPLAFTWYLTAARLGLDVQGFIEGTSKGRRVIAPMLAGSAPFYSPGRDIEESARPSLDRLLSQLIESLVEREMASLRPGLRELFEVHAARSFDRNLAAQLTRRYLNALLTLGERRDEAQNVETRQLLLAAGPGRIDEDFIIEAVLVLRQEVTLPWRERLFRLRPDYVNLAGVSGAELYADMLAQSDGFDASVVVEALSHALTLTPKRAEMIQGKIAAHGSKEALRNLAARRYSDGDRSEGVVRVMAEAALDKGERESALAMLALFFQNEAAVSDKALDMARQALTLAVNLKQLEVGKDILTAAFKRWKAEASLFRLEAELELAAGDPEEGKRLLRRYVEAYPDDKAAAERLAALDDEE